MSPTPLLFEEGFRGGEILTIYTKKTFYYHLDKTPKMVYTTALCTLTLNIIYGSKRRIP